MIVSQDTLEETLKENGRFAGIKNSSSYFMPKRTKGKLEDELSRVEIKSNSLEDRQEAYLEVQKIGDKYLRGIDAGRNILFAGISTTLCGAYGVGLAQRVTDFSAINTPVVKQLAQAVEVPLRFVADKVPMIPYFDKIGHIGLGMYVGRGMGWITEKVSNYMERCSDVDDKGDNTKQSYAMHLMGQIIATGSVALNKEFIDGLTGGVKDMWDFGATMGGQVINGIMDYSRARQYGNVVNAMRKTLYGLGMCDDGHEIELCRSAPRDIAIPFTKASKVKNAIEHGKDYLQFTKATA